jgi:hypothetical protein
MKIETLIEWLSELPKDYDICLSEYSFVELDDDNQEKQMYTIILDKPIVGISKCDDNKEVRFLLSGKDISIERGDYIKDIVIEEEDNGEL